MLLTEVSDFTIRYMHRYDRDIIFSDYFQNISYLRFEFPLVYLETNVDKKI